MTAADQRLPAEAPESPPVCSGLPYRRNESFVGREHDLDRLHQALQQRRPHRHHRANRHGRHRQDPTRRRVCLRPPEATILAVASFGSTPPRLLADGLARLATVPLARAGRSLSNRQNSRPSSVTSASTATRSWSWTTWPTRPTINRPLAPGFVLSTLSCRLLFTTRRRDLGDVEPVELTVLPARGRSPELLLRHPARQPILEKDHPEHETASSYLRPSGLPASGTGGVGRPSGEAGRRFPWPNTKRAAGPGRPAGDRRS